MSVLLPSNRQLPRTQVYKLHCTKTHNSLKTKKSDTNIILVLTQLKKNTIRQFWSWNGKHSNSNGAKCCWPTTNENKCNSFLKFSDSLVISYMHVIHFDHIQPHCPLLFSFSWLWSPFFIPTLPPPFSCLCLEPPTLIHDAWAQV